MIGRINWKDYATINAKLQSNNLKADINQLWELAAKEIHPYQKGDTSQQSDHCMRDIEYLDLLIAHFDKSHRKAPLRPVETFLLVCAAILHDMDKAVFDYEKKIKAKNLHGCHSAKFIKDHPRSFYFSQPVADAVSTITHFHGETSFTSDPNRLQNTTIEDPRKLKIHGAARMDILCALFKLADMMDVSYRRVPQIIIDLNFPDQEVGPKIAARQHINKIEVKPKGIALKLRPIDEFFVWQSIMVALEMMNGELDQKGVQTILKREKMPYFFFLSGTSNAYSAPNSKFLSAVNNRKKISQFNDEWRLEVKPGISSVELRELMKTAMDNAIQLAPTEIFQFCSHYPKFSHLATKKSIDQISKDLNERFFYVIEEMHVDRAYSENGSVNTTVTYKKITKKPASPLPLRFVSTERANPAKILKTSVNITPKDDSSIRFEEKQKKLIISTPRFVNQTVIDNIKLNFVSKKSWATHQTEFKKYYPDDEKFIEDYTVNCRQPICQLHLTLVFPKKLKITPKCEYSFRGRNREVSLKSEENGKFTLIDLVQDTDRTFDEYPKYKFYWDVESF